MGECRDCQRCTRSAVGKLGKAIVAVATVGISEVGVAVVDAFKRTCPTCGHPLAEHEGVAVRMVNPAPPAVVVVHHAVAVGSSEPPRNTWHFESDAGQPDAGQPDESNSEPLPEASGASRELSPPSGEPTVRASPLDAEPKVETVASGARRATRRRHDEDSLAWMVGRLIRNYWKVILLIVIVGAVLSNR